MIEDEVSSEPANEQKVPGQPGRPVERDQFSRESIQATIYEIEALNSIAKEKMLEKLGAEKLDEGQEKMISKLCESIVCATDKENWTESLISCVNDFNEIEK